VIASPTITTVGNSASAAEDAERTRPLRVAHVVLSLDLGGLERLVVDLVDEGFRHGQAPAVVCLERPGTLAPQIEALGARVECVEKPSGIRLGTIHRLKRMFQKLNADVVHTHQIGALFYAGPAARRAHVPVIVHTEHGKHFAGRRRTRWLGRLAGRYADRYCCVSHDIAEEVKTAHVVSEAKVEVVVNGIDTARFTRSVDGAALRHELGIPGGAAVIGTVGRLNEIKRHDLLIRAFARLARKRPEARLLLVGDGPLRSQLESLAAEIVPDRRVHFAGYQPQPERYLQIIDVFALTSRSEGMPLAVLEAWAAGVPVVASCVGGVPELVHEARTGLLFPSGDELSLATAIERLIDDQVLASQLIGAARARVENEFSLSHMAETYDSHYRELHAKKTRPNR
jgi:sugar transferase (PEP-CTERM/EpsH1 system associated)